MDLHSRQLVRLGELIDMSAAALRDLLTVLGSDGALGSAADDLERIAALLTRAGRSAELI